MTLFREVNLLVYWVVVGTFRSIYQHHALREAINPIGQAAHIDRDDNYCLKNYREIS